MKRSRIVVLGTGGWGTALAALWHSAADKVILWGHDPVKVDHIAAVRENLVSLPGVNVPVNVEVTSDLQCCANADIVVFAVPSKALSQVADNVRKVVKASDLLLLSCTKGIEHESGRRMSEIIGDLLPGRTTAVLSGPNLAVEVSRGLPTAAVIGCKDKWAAEELQQQLGSAAFRIYTSQEVASVELGGALKNVFAIAAGISDGLGFGDNSKSALLTRSLAEMLRLGIRMGGDAATFYGLSGAGDLIATCFSKLSRNRAVGEALGAGRTVAEIYAARSTVAEGIPTARSAYQCARRLGVDTPIIDQVYSILYEDKEPAVAFAELLQRGQKDERS